MVQSTYRPDYMLSCGFVPGMRRRFCLSLKCIELDHSRRPHGLLHNGYLGFLPRGQSARGAKLTTYDQLVFRCRMCGVCRYFPADIRLHGFHRDSLSMFNPLKAELNRICHLLALLGAHHILHVSRIRVNFLQANTLFFK